MSTPPPPSRPDPRRPSPDLRGRAVLADPAGAKSRPAARGEERAPSRPRHPDEIRAEIERARDEVADALILLRDEINARLDWRWMVRRRPWSSVGAAFFAGVWLGWR